MFWSIFEVYIANNWKDIEAGKPVECELQSSEDRTMHWVKAQIAHSAKELPGGDELRIKNEDGKVKEETWRVKVLEELDPYEAQRIPPPITTKVPIYGPPVVK